MLQKPAGDVTVGLHLVIYNSWRTLQTLLNVKPDGKASSPHVQKKNQNALNKLNDQKEQL